jgi:hypothetical protein
MIGRRKFISTLGASTVVPGLSISWGTAAKTSQSESAGTRSPVSLGGEWERYIDGSLFDLISVPSSQHPMGFYHLRREFLLPRLSRHQRAFLHFDAITYYGEVSLNGKQLGTMGPYVPYEFEFTEQAREGSNRVEVGIADLTPAPDGRGKAELALGVNPGWEAYGGIIRDVYVKVRPAAFIDNVQFGYNLSAAYGRAECRARVFMSSALGGAGRVEVVVKEGQAEVGRGTESVQLEPGSSEVEVQFAVEAPALWSPEAPNLYELEASLESDAGEDRWRTRTGFREVKIAGNEFLLNGERLVLKGVCRHDMWKGEGFTLTESQRQQDMRMIRELGCNFVRLVHYPHDRRVIELADELGLFVSEEPGYWGMDFRTMQREMIELGYEIMERTIRRDCNSPSVLAWLLGNECKLTVEYLREGKERCRKLDPLSRPVSFANDMPMEQAKPMFEQAGLDFFDQHLYPSDQNAYEQVATFYAGSLPLTFTEWGWEDLGGGTIFPETHTNLLLDLVQGNKLAGHAFWSWQDIRQYSRIDWPTADGILFSGVVSESRNVRPSWYLELTRLFEGRRQQGEHPVARPTVLPLRWSPAGRQASFQPVDLHAFVDGPQGEKNWDAFEARMADFWQHSRLARDQWKRTGERFLLWHESEFSIGGIRFQIPKRDGYVRPLMLTPELPEAAIPVQQECIRLHILGQVTFPSGFPIVGRRGERVATYHLFYSGGEKQELPIRSGIEVARANRIYEATRINPVASAAQPVLEFEKDVVREEYQILFLSLPVRKTRLETVRLVLDTRDSALAVFAITVERPLVFQTEETKP